MNHIKTKVGLLVCMAAFTMLLFPATTHADSLALCKELIDTAQGPVIGQAEPGTDLCVYRGIPYAAPPVGDLRWRPPKPALLREKLLVADSFGPRCMQHAINPLVATDEPQSEDCLYLNIIRPQKSGVFPVMVWIHGGGLLTGSGSDPTQWADKIASQRDVVVVSINYRLGPFGFLAHPDFGTDDKDGTSGNFGLLDQVAALKWVKENISSFGGDPDNVTIFGISAGGWSVCNLLATPLAEGLFHRAIMQSGGCDVVKTREEAYADGEIFADHAGCSGTDTASCLRAKSTEEIMAADLKSRNPNPPFGGIRNWMYTPMVDGRVLPIKQIEAIETGRFNNVPLIIGSARDEAKLWANNEDPFFLRLRPPFMVDRLVSEALGTQVVDDVKRLYPFHAYRRPADAAIDAIGDMTFGCKGFDAVEAAAKHQDRVYYYRIDYDDHLLPHKFGATHGIDVFLLFYQRDVKGFMSLLFRKDDWRRAEPLNEMMIDYWVDFAESGDPNGSGHLEWPTYNLDSRQRMILDLPPHVEQTDNVEKCEFWRDQGSCIVGSLER